MNQEIDFGQETNSRKVDWNEYNTAAVQAVTTFATQARQSSQPSAVVATPSSVASTLAIPTDSAQDTLDFVRSVFKYLVGNN